MTFVYMSELLSHVGLTGLAVLLNRAAWAAVTCPFQGPLKGVGSAEPKAVAAPLNSSKMKDNCIKGAIVFALSGSGNR